MYDYISGTLSTIRKESITVENGGIGWKIIVSSKFLKQVPQEGAKVRLFVVLIIRENDQTLYGFESEKERQFFEKLITINGVGPKTALAIIGHIEFGELSDAIVKKDIRPFCRVPGVGKKTAERLLIDLNDALPLVASLTTSVHGCGYSADAISALINLGYTTQVAHRSVQQAIAKNPPKDLPSLIMAALKE